MIKAALKWSFQNIPSQLYGEHSGANSENKDKRK